MSQNKDFSIGAVATITVIAAMPYSLKPRTHSLEWTKENTLSGHVLGITRIG